jgi:anaerobic selenocysteine-containing dehydrogenase
MIKAEELLKKGISRRAFNTGALAAAAVLAGCGGNGSDETIVMGSQDTYEPEPELQVRGIYGTGTHNCGGRCVVRADVASGRIIRILTDDNEYAGDGTYLNPNSRNLPQTRPCSRCRAYRYRVHHPGRLRYPLKQTKKRGDLSGFKRISWDEALNAVAKKHRDVYDYYGLDGIYVLYDSSANAGVQGRDALEVAYRYMGYKASPDGETDGNGFCGALWKDQFGTYSAHQNAYVGVGYTGMNGATNANDIAKNTKSLVLWGDNYMTTYNNSAYSYAKVAEELKAKGVRTYFVGPELSDTGIVIADEWLVSKPFTDPALVAGMVYHMLENTFNLSNGQLLPAADRWLDVDWLDTMVYGFFDSPAYDLDETTGDITVPVISTPPAAGHRNVPAVPTGRSYASWVLGSNNNARDYSDTATNYTATRFTGTKRWAECDYTVSVANTKYKTKQDFKTPKTPAWASAITGIPVGKIIELAEIFAKEGPVASLWSGGFQKQADGVINQFAVQALHVITKNVSKKGTVFSWGMGPSITKTGGAPAGMTNATISKNVPKAPQRPTASCTAWHTVIKAAFMDELRAPATPVKGQYNARYIPNWPGKPENTPNFTPGVSYWDDGGTKAAVVQWVREWDPGTQRALVKTYFDGTNRYFDWVGRLGNDGMGGDGDPAAHTGTPVFAGIRLLYNSASNIIINQHENSNDSRDMLECLKPDDGTKDTFCLVTFDNFMSPTAQWSDYVLPTSTNWEHPNFVTPNHSDGYFVPQAVNPPGESKQAWSLCIELLREYENLQTTAKSHVSGTPTNGVAASYAGGNVNNSIEGLAKANYYSGPYTNPASPFFGKIWDEYLKNPVLKAKPNDLAEAAPAGEATRLNYDALNASDKLFAFIKNDSSHSITTNDYNHGGYNGGITAPDNVPDLFADISSAPMPSLRYHVYSPVFTWQYRNLFSKWHGWLYGQTDPQGNSLVGQQHKDFEGDEIVLEIPLYYAYEDYFLEAYGNDPAKVAELPFLMTTTHDKYRSHSSLAENPLLRELCHRVPGRDAKGKPKQGNDYGDYAMGPAQDFNSGSVGDYPPLSRKMNPDGTVDAANKEIVSYSEIWINETDGISMGLEDGDLVLAENPVGAVRCVARLSKRCARGFVGLHQGCWSDFRPNLPNSYGHEYVDVGGNCNTLMASQPSRVDHGNGQQSAMVKISKVTDY